MATEFHIDPLTGPLSAVSALALKANIADLGSFTGPIQNHLIKNIIISNLKLKNDIFFIKNYYMSQCMRFSTMWYLLPAKPQISLGIRAV